MSIRKRYKTNGAKGKPKTNEHQKKVKNNGGHQEKEHKKEVKKRGKGVSEKEKKRGWYQEKVKTSQELQSCPNSV